MNPAYPKPPALALCIRLLRDPLLHFLAIGALLFWAYRQFAEEPDSRTIVISGAVRTEIALEFEAERGRRATPAELREALDLWKRTEVLYREGLRLGLDRGDAQVRARIATKLREVNENLWILPKPTDAELDTWLRGQRQPYDRNAPRAELEADFQNAARVRASQEATRRLVSQYTFVEEP